MLPSPPDQHLLTLALEEERPEKSPLFQHGVPTLSILVVVGVGVVVSMLLLVVLVFDVANDLM
jgi:hypothetical protein